MLAGESTLRGVNSTMPSSRRALFATAESSLSELDLLSPAVLTSHGRPRKERVPKFSSKDILALLFAVTSRDCKAETIARKTVYCFSAFFHFE